MPDTKPEYPLKPYLSSFGHNRSRQLGKERSERYAEGMTQWGIAIPEGDQVDPRQWFAETVSDIVVELGIGTGDYLLACAERNPTTGYIGCEPYQLGIATAIKHAVERGIANTRYFQGDGRDLLQRVRDDALAGASVLFPDPWPKARHHKRRLVNDYLIGLMARVIRQGGELFLATDHADYAEWMLEVMARQSWFVPTVRTAASPYEVPADWVATRYYQKALLEGRKPIFLQYLKK